MDAIPVTRDSIAFGMIQTNLVATLHTLGLRDTDFDMIERAVTIGLAEARRRDKVKFPRFWAHVVLNTGLAQLSLGRLRADPAAYRAALATADRALAALRDVDAICDWGTGQATRAHALSELGILENDPDRVAQALATARRAGAAARAAGTGPSRQGMLALARAALGWLRRHRRG